ncbi:dihydrolipoamide acetyltransferase family protein [Ectobacillus sp. sgz5001026]|uniref:dihydrolipoamide acetyltransferase family protein n=1 Tax=Ectobacillus sp. sgz5001026 TaxID=3242473 RepID=UPI0036D275A6
MGVEIITMPQLGESVTEGTISKWLVQTGDHVNKYDPLAEVMTDKVNAEIPSSFTGVISEIIAQEGDTLVVGAGICKLITEETERTVVQEEREIQQTQDILKDSSMPKARYSPAVLKLAHLHQIDLATIQGTGLQGRITRKDVLRIAEKGAIPSAIEQVPIPMKNEEVVEKKEAVASPSSYDVEVPVSSVRKAIAANMVRSKQEVPHAWMMVEVDVTNLVAYRNQIKDEFKKGEGFNLTYFSFFVKAVARALKEYPQMNAMWAGDKIIQKKDINISIAVATDSELFVPVIKRTDEKTIKGIAREINDLAGKVRTKSLGLDDLQGGTFTVNNTGTFGSIQSMGIINYPQAAIVQIESIVKRPVVMDNGYIGVRDMVNICLSLDHRVLDGLICGRFLQRVKAILESVSKETTSIY